MKLATLLTVVLGFGSCMALTGGTPGPGRMFGDAVGPFPPVLIVRSDSVLVVQQHVHPEAATLDSAYLEDTADPARTTRTFRPVPVGTLTDTFAFGRPAAGATITGQVCGRDFRAGLRSPKLCAPAWSYTEPVPAPTAPPGPVFPVPPSVVPPTVGSLPGADSAARMAYLLTVPRLVIETAAGIPACTGSSPNLLACYDSLTARIPLAQRVMQAGCGWVAPRAAGETYTVLGHEGVYPESGFGECGRFLAANNAAALAPTLAYIQTQARTGTFLASAGPLTRWLAQRF